MQKSVIEYLERTVCSYPNKEAVRDAEMVITFSELWDAAKRISNGIKAECVVKNSPVGVFIPKGCKMVESFAGINMCGCFYVPLDTKSPDSRVSSILTALEATCVITDKAHEVQLSNFYQGKTLVIENVIANVQPDGGDKNDTTQIDTDPVYSIFTSGSTGIPKGVVIAHRGVIDYINWAVSTFRITSESVIGNQAPFYFDNSTLDIYLMYSTGATLDIIPESCFAFPAKLIDYLNEHKITFVFWVPFVLVNVANMNILASKKPDYLKDVFFAGEVMPNKHLNYWRKHLPNCRYANLYGPTEITVDCTYYVVEREFTDDEPLPIGFPCRNSDVLILVNRKRLAKQGEQGELCVRGSSLALGYYNNPEKTTAAFIQNPLHSHYPETIYCTGDVVYENEQGEIMYVGRVDAQIKHNGYRIELGEIETAILGINMVDNCCVVYDFANKKIVLFYQAAEDLNMAEFRKALATKIPRYMLPTEYHREEILKQNNSGKIDRAYYTRCLRETMRTVESFEEMQQQVAEIRSLKLGFITNFFADPVKHSLWIKKGDCFIVRINNTLFIIKKSLSFWNVFYCSTALEALENDLEDFQAKYSKTTMMFDIVGREIQCQPLVELFKAKGCKEATLLVRMTRMTEPMDYKQDDIVHYASEKDLPLISQYLHTYFDEQTEQIPYDEELVDYTKRGHILICEEAGQMAGFLIFELNATTLYLRYWFTHPNYRNQKVGSRLLRRFFEEGKKTKRQLFWVIRTNDNAIKRYKHYGFSEENMYDFVMQYN